MLELLDSQEICVALEATSVGAGSTTLTISAATIAAALTVSASHAYLLASLAWYHDDNGGARVAYEFAYDGTSQSQLGGSGVAALADNVLRQATKEWGLPIPLTIVGANVVQITVDALALNKIIYAKLVLYRLAGLGTNAT